MTRNFSKIMYILREPQNDFIFATPSDTWFKNLVSFHVNNKYL